MGQLLDFGPCKISSFLQGPTTEFRIVDLGLRPNLLTGSMKQHPVELRDGGLFDEPFPQSRANEVLRRTVKPPELEQALTMKGDGPTHVIMLNE